MDDPKPASELADAPAARRSSVTLVMKGVGERTSEACRRLLAAQSPGATVWSVREAPSGRAVQRTFEIGLADAREWLFVADADVLLRPGAVSRLVSVAEGFGENCFGVEGRVIDKAFGGPRHAGNHLYRTALLDRALRFIPASLPRIRPETFVFRQMAGEGHPWRRDEHVMGLHDFEQYFKDLYRKAMVHAHKHGPHLRFFEPMWSRLSGRDPDYQALRWGLAAGRTTRGPRIDVRMFPGEITKLLGSVGLAEKGSLAPDAVTPQTVEEQVVRFVPPPEYQAWHTWWAEQEAKGLSEQSRSTTPSTRPGMLRRLLGSWGRRRKG